MMLKIFAVHLNRCAFPEVELIDYDGAPKVDPITDQISYS
jgi:hypothetical protein